MPPTTVIIVTLWVIAAAAIVGDILLIRILVEQYKLRLGVDWKAALVRARNRDRAENRRKKWRG